MKRFTLLILSFLSAILITIMFFEGGLGLIASLVTACLLLTFYVSFKQAQRFNYKRGYLLLISLILLSISFVFRDQLGLHLLNLLVFFVLSTVYVVHMLNDQPFRISSHLIIKSLEQTFYPLGDFNVPFQTIFKGRGKVKDLSPTSKSILLGLVIALPILMIMMALLASADEVFSSMITMDTSWFENFFDDTSLPKAFTFVFWSLYIFSFFYYALKKKRDDLESQEEKHIQVKKTSSDLTISTILVLMNLLFIVFTFIQFKYLFSKGNVGFDSFTYSSYARKGFFELTVISMLNLILILIFTQFSKSKMNNLMMTLMIACTLIIAYSAIFRMNLYISAYGFTWLRIVSLSFIILQMILLVITGFYLWYRHFHIITVLSAFYLLAYLVLNFSNIDGSIVEGNIKRYLQGQELDAYYFEDLSYDATDAIIKYYKKFSNDDEHALAFNDLKMVLYSFEDSLDQDIKWFHFNYSKYHAKSILNP